uniref:CapA family protein n=1 Tax=candidate division WOR-3 bacterium TaxID=2052148 RepID=A0A7C4U9V4_UNCW3
MKDIIIYACGDLTLTENISKIVKEKGISFIFSEIKKEIKNGIFLLNLELPFSDDLPPYFNYVDDRLRVPSENIEVLKFLKSDIVNIGTNHIKDFGDISIKRTINLLEKNKILHIGAGLNEEESRAPAIIKTKSLKLGFLGYCKNGIYTAKNNQSGAAPLIYKKIVEDINNFKNKVDIIIISLHWGYELSMYPSPEQVELAHSLIDKGVDVIIGHHPHVIQAVEKYKNGVIFYSLGNFLFDPNVERIRFERKLAERKEGIIGKIIIKEDKKLEMDIIPIYVNNDFSIKVADKDKREKIMRDIRKSINAIVSGNLKQIYYTEGIKDLIKREISTYIFRIKREKGNFFIWFLRNFKIRYIKEIFYYFIGIMKKHGG